MDKFTCAVTLILLLPLVSAAEDTLPAEAKAAADKAFAYMQSIATEGGWLWRYSLDLKERAGEEKATATQIWIQPPGTPSMGTALLGAYETTGDKKYLDAAKAAANALAIGQLESGGWDYSIDFDPQKAAAVYRRSDKEKVSAAEAAKRRNISTYDDNTTQSAVQFLMAVVDASKGSREERDLRIREARDYALAKLLEAQYPIGAWPQRYDGKPKLLKDFPILKASIPDSWPREWPKQDYRLYYTLNDSALFDCIRTMLEAHRRYGNPEYLDAARRGGNFLLLAQLPEPQSAWAQQYNARMEPVWARAFEPPAVTAGESVGAVHILIELYNYTGDDKYLAPLPKAIDWWKRSELAPDTWARFYELGTNKPIYGDRDGKIYYRVEEISQERRTGYSWQGSYGIASALRAYEQIRRDGRKFSWTKNKPLTARQKSERAKTLEPSVRQIIATLDSQGRWITKGQFVKRATGIEFGDRVETQVFIRNLKVLCDYLSAASADRN